MKNYKLKHIGGQQCLDPISILKAPERLIAIGDIHGDMDLMLTSLRIGGLIEKMPDKDINTVTLEYKDYSTHYYKWVGGNTVVIQVGDQVDRCRPYLDKSCNETHTTFEDEASDEKILNFFTDLHKIAILHGGAVYSLLGNHELRNAMGLYDYVSYLGLKEYTPNGEKVDDKWRGEHFKRGKRLSNFMACTRSSIMIVGKFMFVHGGFIETLILEAENYKTLYKEDLESDKTNMIKHLNKLVQIWLQNPNLYSKDVHNLINGINSPFLVRGLGYIPPNLSMNNQKCKNVKEVLDYFNIKGMVIGHTPQITKGINTTCSKSIYRVDVASSKAFEHIIDDLKTSKTREPQVLEILNDCEVNVITFSDGRYNLKKCQAI